MYFFSLQYITITRIKIAIVTSCFTFFVLNLSVNWSSLEHSYNNQDKAMVGTHSTLSLANTTLVEILTKTQNELTVILTVVDESNRQFIFNWMCHIQDMQLDGQLIIITSGDSLKDDIEKNQVVKHQPFHVISLEKDLGKMNPPIARYSLTRTKWVSIFVLEILKRNFEVFLFRIESVWLQNPIEIFHLLKQNDESIDIVSTGFNKSPSTVDAGLIFVRPTSPAISFWKHYMILINEILSRYGKLQDQESENPCSYFSQLLYRRYAQVNYYLVPVRQIQDDCWYVGNHVAIDSVPKGHDKFAGLYIVRAYSNNVTNQQTLDDYSHWFLDIHGKCQYDRVVKAEQSIWRLGY